MTFDPAGRLSVLGAQIAALARGQHPEPPSAYGLPVDEADELMAAIYARGDRLMGRFLLVHAGIAAGLSVFYETWMISAVVTLCALGIFFVNAWLLPQSLRRASPPASHCRRSSPCTSIRCTGWPRCTSGSSPPSR